MRYLLLICDDESVSLTAEELAEHPGHQGWHEEMTRRGVLQDWARLRPVDDATAVRVRAGETLVSDGPFAETKELVGGYAMVDCADLDAAIEVAAAHPIAEYGTIEVRPVWE